MSLTELHIYNNTQMFTITIAATKECVQMIRNKPMHISLCKTRTSMHTHTCELILNVGPSSVGLVHTWDPIELCWRVTYTIHTKWRPNRYRRM